MIADIILLISTVFLLSLDIPVIFYGAALGFIMLLCWISNQEKKMRAAKLEKMAKLYRFAKFGKISCGAFHDLINPLTSVHLLLSEIDNDRLPCIPEIKNTISNAIKVSSRMQSFINALQKQMRYDDCFEKFNPRKEVEEALTLLSYKIRKSGCQASLKEKKPVELFGNPVTFYQVVANLISNSVDSYDGISKENKPINIAIGGSETRFILEITDEGCGISPEMLPRLFSPFFTTKPLGKGTGLGLSTTKYIIEKGFGGTVTIRNRKPSGTSCRIVIPIHKKSPSDIQDFPNFIVA